MILVTGGTGLVGAHLLLHLTEKGENVRAIYRNIATLEKPKKLFKQNQQDDLFQKIDWVEADILDIPSLEIAFENIDYVYHCAAMISFDPKEENLLRKVNIEGTANIVNFCVAKDVKKLCYVSSIAALGDVTSNATIITEKTEWDPEVYHSDYAISKYGAEMEVWRGLQEGLAVVIVNPGVILGATIWRTGSGLIFEQLKNGLSFYTKGQTGYVSVTDVAKAMTKLMHSSISGDRYTLVAEHFTYEAIINLIATKMGVKPPRFYAKPWITSVAWRLDWISATFFGRKRKLSKFGAQSIHNVDWYSNEKIKNTPNFEFQSIENAIEDIIYFDKKQE